MNLSVIRKEPVLSATAWLSALLVAAGAFQLACSREVHEEHDIDEITGAASSSSCSFTVTKNSFDGSQRRGTISFRNNGPASSSNHVVEFKLPSGVHCTTDSVPAGAVLSPLSGNRTVSNHCIFTWTNTTPLAALATKTFTYSATSQAVTSAGSLRVTDTMCGGGSTSCNTFILNQNSYDGPEWWGTIKFTNSGPFTSTAYVVAFDVPSGVHCTAEPESVPNGATLTPLTATGNPRRTTGRHCVFTWSNGPALAPGASKTFNYSTDSQNFSAASNVTITDLACDPSGGGGSGGTGTIVETGTDVGTVLGDFEVTPGGTAIYEVPLWTPAGRGGLTPHLSLSYSSAGGDGPAGFGWSVQGGTSQIARCVANIPTDTRPAPVGLVSNNYCIDGSRLVLVSGTDGAVNAEYRTQPDTFLKVVIDEADTYGPRQFTAYGRDGLIHTYGSRSTAHDPSLEVMGESRPWVVTNESSRDDSVVQQDTVATPTRQGWLRGTIRDRSGNTIWFRFFNASSATGQQEPLLDTIEYVDVSGGTKSRAIKFNYVARSNVSQSQRIRQVVGLPLASTRLLRSIDMMVAPPGTSTRATVRSYQLMHSNSTTTVRPRLDSIQECDGKPGTSGGRPVWCKKATTFSYESGASAYSPVPLPGLADMVQLFDSPFWGVYPADLDRDGNADLIYRARQPGAGINDPPHWYARLASGPSSAPFSPPIDLGLQNNAIAGDPLVADMDNDGYSDIAVPASAGAYAIYINRRTSPFFGSPRFVESGAGTMAAQVADFSGRGRVSILRPAGASSGQWVYSFFRTDCDSNGEFCSVVRPPFSNALPVTFELNKVAGWNTFAADADGDRARDLFSRGTSPHRLAILKQTKVPGGDPLSAGDWSLPERTTLLASEESNLVSYIMLDHNGDGLTDVLRLRQGEAVPALVINSGNGYARAEPLTSLATELGGVGNVALGARTNYKDIKDPGIRVLDYDGDNKDDILLVDNGAVRDSTLASNPGKRQKMVVLLSRGSGFQVYPLDGQGGRPDISIGRPAEGPSGPDSGQVHNYKQTQLLDVNGDGLKDIFMVGASGEPQVLIRVDPKPDLLIGIKDGMGRKTTVSYAPMSDRSVYAPGATCTAPQKCVTTSGDRLVRKYSVDNGRGAEQQTLAYRYHDLRFDTQSGVIGFASWTITDTSSNISVKEDFEVERSSLLKVTPTGAVKCVYPFDGCVYPFLGLPKKKTIAPLAGGSATRTVVTDYVYELVPTNGGRSFYTRVRGANGSAAGGITETTTDSAASVNPIAKVVSIPAYDSSHADFGLVAGEMVTTTTDRGDFVKVWKASYDNYPSGNMSDPTPWLIGVKNFEINCSSSPEEATKASLDNCTRFGNTTIPRRVTTFVRHKGTGQVESMEIQPEGGVDEHLSVEYTRSPPYGLLTMVTRRDETGSTRTDAIGYDVQSVHPKTLTNAAGHIRTQNADPGLGVVLSVTDPNGVTAAFDYDGFGRPRGSRHPGGAGTSTTYSRGFEPNSGSADERYVMIASTVDNGGGEVREYRNRVGQSIRREQRNLDGTYSYRIVTYDHLGYMASITRPALVNSNPAGSTEWHRDGAGRVVQIVRDEEAVDGNGSTVPTVDSTVLYFGLKSTITDEVGRHRRQEVDPFGRVVRAEVDNDDGQAVPTEFVYGAFNVLRFVIRNDGSLATGHQRTTEMRYDGLGRRTLLIDPSTGTRTRKYNAFGDVREEIDGDGSVATFTLDVLGRVKERDDKDLKTTFTWDTAVSGKGRLAETLSASGVRQQFFYDGAGRLYREVWTIDGSPYQLDYTYDPSTGKLKHVIYPNVPGHGRLTVTNSYDPNSGRLLKVQNDASSTPYWRLSGAGVDGQMSAETFGNNLLTTTYDRSPVTGRVRSILTKKGTASLRSWDYAYLPDGQLQRRSDLLAGQHERFEYDSLTRLRRWMATNQGGAAITDGWKVDYKFDDFGNLTERNFQPGTVTGGTPQALVYGIEPASDRLMSSPWGGYSYNGNGEQTARMTGTSDSETIDYTAFGLPKTISGPRAATFKYDAFNGRAKKAASSTKYSVYVAGLYEKRVSGTTSSPVIDHVLYVVGPNGPVAQVTRREGASSETVRYLHADRLGSIDMVTSDTGGIVQQTKRDPYGNLVMDFNQPVLSGAASSTPTDTRLGFTGHEQDDELGLVNMKGRMFDPRLGRFLSADPFVQEVFDGASHNRYAYVGGSPLTYVDPTGFWRFMDNVPPPTRGPGSRQPATYQVNTDPVRVGRVVNCQLCNPGPRPNSPEGSDSSDSDNTSTDSGTGGTEDPSVVDGTSPGSKEPIIHVNPDDDVGHPVGTPDATGHYPGWTGTVNGGTYTSWTEDSGRHDTPWTAGSGPPVDHGPGPAPARDYGGGSAGYETPVGTEQQDDSGILRLPDIISLAGSLPFPNLRTGTFVGIGATVSLGRSGTLNVAAGPVAGYPTAGGLSLMANWLLQARKPTPQEVDAAMEGLSVSFQGGYIVGGQFSTSLPNGGSSFGVGLTTPGVGVGASYGWNILDTGICW